MSDAHQTLDIHRARRDLDILHDRVARNWGRIEITRDGSPACVLVSKAELQSIERALEILCDSPGGKQICEELRVLADKCVQSFRAPNSGRPHLGAMLQHDADGAAAQL